MEALHPLLFVLSLLTPQISSFSIQPRGMLRNTGVVNEGYVTTYELPRPNEENVFGRQDEEDGGESSSTRQPLIPWSTPRIHDFISGLTGIVQGVAKGNPEKLLEGSFEFIPPGVRVGIKGILSSIAGRPIAQSKTTTAATTTTPAPLLKSSTSSADSDEEEEETK